MTEAHSELEIVGQIAAASQERLIKVVAQRVFSRLSIDLRVSVERSGTAGVRSVDDLKVRIKGAVEAEAQKAHDLFDFASVSQIIDDEYSVCQSAIAGGRSEEMLKIFEAKAMIWPLCRIAGCPNPEGMLNAVAKHLAPKQFPSLKRLKEKLELLLS